MNRIDRAAVEFSLLWHSDIAEHTERFYLDRVDFWRDGFPGQLGDHLSRLSPGESCREHFEAGSLVDPYSERNLYRLPRDFFEAHENSLTGVPTLGRYYPQGMAWKLFNCFPQTMAPFRLVGQDSGFFVADTNHPLAAVPIDLEASIVQRWDSGS